ncbi:uncharacterized protein LOC142517877 isoform X1 [Primulina tabacum]|uniref:uncharacterized protein LOC142517877 isoform X1 n=1 Tax=Primulina tabacum TaxID=48773 RepID=UPI003F59FF7C
MKEILTVQIGSYANFIGSHFWNFQDELLGLADNPQSDEIFKNHHFNMDVLYRAGETRQGIFTHTPRLVSVDFQGSLGCVSASGTLYNEVPVASIDTPTWKGSITTQASEPLKKNLFLQSLDSAETDEDMDNSRGYDGRNSDSQTEYQDKDIVACLEDGVQYWTDFSKVHYHPQSLYELNGLWMDPEDFNNYGIGRDAFSGCMSGEEINERLRFFVEECDLIQGFQFIVDDSGGFSGVAGEFLENIADEYTNVPVLLYCARSPNSYLNAKSQKQIISSKIHDAVSLARLSSFCKLIVPVGLPSLSTSRLSKYLCVKDQKPYHTSAVYASAIHSISLPFRMQPLGPSTQVSHACGAVDINQLMQMTGGQSRQNMVTILDVSMPVPGLTGNQSPQCLLENLLPLTPELAEVEDMLAVESITVHGVFGTGYQRASVPEVKDAVQASYLNSAARPKFSHLSVAQCPLPIPLPFPSVFSNLVGQHGEILDGPISGPATTRGPLEVHSIPMAARLRSSSAVLPYLEDRLINLRRLGIARGALGTELLRSWGFGKDDLDDMGETLSKMVSTLNPFSEESSDSE